VVRYHPAVGVVLNLQRDHKEMDVVAEMFRAFKGNTSETFVVGDSANLIEFANQAVVIGLDPRAQVRAENLELTASGSRFQVEGVDFSLPVPGRHNVENALAAMASCRRAVGVSFAAMASPLLAFQGVARRFQRLGTRRGVQVVDDFGHNPAKIAASIRAARMCATRVLAVFQPHGYGPMRFLRKDFVETFAKELHGEDRLWMLEIFYAGGTATRDFSSGDIVAEIQERGTLAEFAPSRDGLVAALATEARAGDLILVMGARDPSLTEFSKAILAAL